LRRQQMRMLELLLEVDRICKKHHISYWLSSGTLIGAARHGGFIPWDDDLDIEMLLPDYKRLLEVLPQELPETMALQSVDTDKNYFFFYAKVRDRRSLAGGGQPLRPRVEGAGHLHRLFSRSTSSRCGFTCFRRRRRGTSIKS